MMISLNYQFKKMIIEKKHNGAYGVLGQHVPMIVNNIDEDIVF